MTKIEAIKAEYAPYHKMDAFEHGFSDYNMRQSTTIPYRDVWAQAYDRGRECAMRVMRSERNVLDTINGMIDKAGDWKLV